MPRHYKIEINSTPFNADLSQYPLRITNDTIDDESIVYEIFTEDAGNGSKVWFSFDPEGSQLPIRRHTTLRWDMTNRIFAFDVLSSPTSSGGITIYMHVGSKPSGYDRIPSGYGDESILSLPLVSSSDDTSGTNKVITETGSPTFGTVTSPDGKTPATNLTGTQHLSVEAYTAEESFEVPGGFTNTGLAYDPQDNVFYIGKFDDGGPNPRIIVTTLTGDLVREITIPNDPQGIVYDTSDNTLWHVSNSSSTVYHINKDGTPASDLPSFDSGQNNNGVAYKASDDSLFISTFSSTGTIKKYNASTGALIETFTATISGVSELLDGLFYLPETDELMIINDGTDEIWFIDAEGGATRTVKRRLRITNSPEHLTRVGNDIYYTSDQEFHDSISGGNRIYTLKETNQNRTITMWYQFGSLADQTGTIFEHGSSLEASDGGYGVFQVNATTMRIFASDTITRIGGSNITVDDATSGWSHIAIVFDRSNSNIKLYQNGTERGTVTIPVTYQSMELFQQAGLSQSVVNTSVNRNVAGNFYNINHFSDAKPVAWFNADYLLQSDTASTYSTVTEIETTIVWDIISGGRNVNLNFGKFGC